MLRRQRIVLEARADPRNREFELEHQPLACVDALAFVIADRIGDDEVADAPDDDPAALRQGRSPRRMKLSRDMDAAELIKALARLGYRPVRQTEGNGDGQEREHGKGQKEEEQAQRWNDEVENEQHGLRAREDARRRQMTQRLGNQRQVPAFPALTLRRAALLRMRGRTAISRSDHRT